MKNNMFIIDRLENNSVVLEDDCGDILTIDKSLIEGEIKEGNIVIKESGLFNVDIKATIDRKNKINALMKGMWE